MIEFAIHLGVSALLLMLVASVVDGIKVSGGLSALLAALVLGLVNALMLMLTSALVPGFKVRGFTAALIGGLLLSILNLLVAWAFGIG